MKGAKEGVRVKGREDTHARQCWGREEKKARGEEMDLPDTLVTSFLLPPEAAGHSTEGREGRKGDTGKEENKEGMRKERKSKE